MHTITYSDYYYKVRKEGISQYFCKNLFEAATPASMHKETEGRIKFIKGDAFWIKRKDLNVYLSLVKLDSDMMPIFKYYNFKGTLIEPWLTIIVLNEDLFDLPKDGQYKVILCIR